MDLDEYLESRRNMVEEGLQEFIHSRFQDELMELAAYMALGGKRLRGAMALLTCEAVGGTPEDAMIAACAVELCQAASLVKDDVMDQDEERRGKESFWKRYGLGMSLMASDLMAPHAMLFVQTYGLRAMGAVASAWARLAKGQLMDTPVSGVFRIKEADYETIIGLKTAPLFELPAELGVRAAKKDWLINMAKLYGFHCGMAFQIYDDASDLLKFRGQPWESMTKGKLPASLQALKTRIEGGQLITEDDYTKTLELAEPLISGAQKAAQAFPDSSVKDHLFSLPQYCCNALLAEALESRPTEEVPSKPLGVEM